MSDQLHGIIGDQPLARQNALFAGDEIRSINKTFRLVFQNDGNLVLYIDDSIGNPNAGLIDRAVWSAYTENHAASYAIMQWDGNFVVYDSFNNHFFDTGTSGNPGAFIIIQDDGNLVVYASDGLTPLWWSHTSVGEAPGANAA